MCVLISRRNPQMCCYLLLCTGTLHPLDRLYLSSLHKHFMIEHANILWAQILLLNTFKTFTKLQRIAQIISGCFQSCCQIHFPSPIRFDQINRDGKTHPLIRASLFSAQREKRSSIQLSHSTQLLIFSCLPVCSVPDLSFYWPILDKSIGYVYMDINNLIVNKVML